jgi:hypothetical protein
MIYNGVDEALFQIFKKAMKPDGLACQKTCTLAKLF